MIEDVEESTNNTYHPSFVENIYLSQKKLVNEAKKNKSSKTIPRVETKNDSNKYLIFNENDFSSQVINWHSAEFDSEECFNEEYPFIKSRWEHANIPYNPDGVDIKRLVFKSNEEIFKAEIYLDVTLKGDSTFWLFTRSKEYLDKYTAVIKINKEEGQQKVFVSFGTFIEDSNANLIFKIFLKRQIISFSKIPKKSMVEKDLCQIKGTVLDSGDGKIKAKFYLNDSKIENNVEGDFFLPVINRFRLLIGGTGEMVWVKSFYAKFMKLEIEDENFSMSNERKNCECCIVF